MAQNKQKILIVGAGLVGSLAGLFLARRGYEVSIFERRNDPRNGNIAGGRSINLALSNRGLKALDRVGLTKKVSAMMIPMHGRMMHDPHGGLTFQPYGRENEAIHAISRRELNMLLLEEAEQSGVNVTFSHPIEHVDVKQNAVVVSLPHGSEVFPADLIIGADGAFSAVRGALQATDRFNYEQRYLEHGYKELTIPAVEGDWALDKQALHIWPRGHFMLIALPNLDGSFTCTLFLPFEGEPSFASLTTDAEVQRFFATTFPDTVPLIPTLIEDFHTNPTSSLVMVKCYPWVRNHTVVLGDAAHAIVPFYGQGMNCGFEDCRILDAMIDQYDGNWEHILPAFQQHRKPDADAIADLALQNFIEMRDLVADPDFLLRKKIEAKLYALFPEQWIPLYSMVTFNEDMRYSEARDIGIKQARIMDDVMQTPGIHEGWESLDFRDIVARL